MAVLGIDLGTTNSVVATVNNGEPSVVPDDKGRRLHPSVIHLGPGGKQTTGHEAMALRDDDPEFTAFSFKRFMGGPLSDPRAAEAQKKVPYTLLNGPNEQPCCKALTARTWSPSCPGSFCGR